MLGKREKTGLREIAIVIDDWDDIFSDFDPRPLNQRVLSEDFITELKKRYRETPRGEFMVVIYAPGFLRNKDSEKMVTLRLKKHFRLRALQRHKDIVRVRVRGCVFVLFGVFFLTFLTLAAYFKLFSHLVLEIIGIVVMPLGWFGLWEGFSKIVDTSPHFLSEQGLYNKLARAAYKFVYEQP